MQIIWEEFGKNLGRFSVNRRLENMRLFSKTNRYSFMQAVQRFRNKFLHATCYNAPCVFWQRTRVNSWLAPFQHGHMWLFANLFCSSFLVTNRTKLFFQRRTPGLLKICFHKTKLRSLSKSNTSILYYGLKPDQRYRKKRVEFHKTLIRSDQTE